jgi:hypothetical protein
MQTKEKLWLPSQVSLADFVSKRNLTPNTAKVNHQIDDQTNNA